MRAGAEEIVAEEALPFLPSFRLDGRRALVTGAGRGIGAAAAAALAEAGAEVVLAARTLAQVERIAAQIRGRGGAASPLALDVSDPEAVRREVDALPAFDVLVNNAGMNRPGQFFSVSVEDFDAVLGLNLRAAFFVAQAVARKMAEEGRRGSIVNLSSQMGHVGGPGRTVYCASKFGLEGMTKAMALDLAPHGIRVNTLCPTFVETPMTRPFLAEPRFRSEVLSKIKLGRLARSEDLIGGLVFLASDAAAMMTGASLLVDGGWTAD